MLSIVSFIFLPFRGSGRVDPLGKGYTKKLGEPPPFGGDFLPCFEPEFHELSNQEAEAKGAAEYSAQRERARVRPFRGGFRVGKCHRLGAIGWSLGQVGSPVVVVGSGH